MYASDTEGAKGNNGKEERASDDVRGDSSKRVDFWLVGFSNSPRQNRIHLSVTRANGI
jgi:hypothetical protein